MVPEDRFGEESIYLSAHSTASLACSMPNSTMNEIKPRLIGMCEASFIGTETDFVLNWGRLSGAMNTPKWWYQSIRNSSITYVGSNNWVIADNQWIFHSKEEVTTKSKSIQNGYSITNECQLLNRQTIFFDNPVITLFLIIGTLYA